MHCYVSYVSTSCIIEKVSLWWIRKEDIHNCRAVCTPHNQLFDQNVTSTNVKFGYQGFRKLYAAQKPSDSIHQQNCAPLLTSRRQSASRQRRQHSKNWYFSFKESRQNKAPKRQTLNILQFRPGRSAMQGHSSLCLFLKNLTAWRTVPYSGVTIFLSAVFWYWETFLLQQ